MHLPETFIACSEMLFSPPPPPLKSTMPDIKETSKAKLDMKGPTRPHDKVTYARNAYLSPHHGRLADKPPNIEIYPFKQTRKSARWCKAIKELH